MLTPANCGFDDGGVDDNVDDEIVPTYTGELSSNMSVFSCRQTPN